MFVNKTYPNKVTYSKTEKNIFGNYAIEKVEKTPIDDDHIPAWLLFSGVILVAGLIVIFTF